MADAHDEPERKRRRKAELGRVREANFRDAAAWSHDQAFSVRRYESYQAYVGHQAGKLERIREKLEAGFETAVAEFQAGFATLPLPAPSSVLCLGARLGGEVAAFLSLGHFAVGVDLNPGPSNRYVVSGDFHNLVQADRSVDCVYTNCCDHLFDLDAFLREVRRVLKPGGLFVADLIAGFEEGFWVGEFAASHWPNAQGFARILAQKGGFRIESFANLAHAGAPQWWQCVMRAEGE